MISKSYTLLNYLNRPHSRLSQLLFGNVAWLGSLVATRDVALANWSRQCFLRNDFKQGVRTCAWLARVSWPKLHVWGDQFFDFTEGADGDMLESMEQFLKQRQKRQPSHVLLSDQLYVLAARVHETIKKTDGQPGPVELIIDEYNFKCNELLEAVSRRLVDKKADVTEEREGDFSVEHAKCALKDFADLFPKEDWPWYLVSGTLLGVYRDGGFMSHDYDIDVGINDGEVDADAMLVTLNQNPSFVVKKVDYHLAVSREQGGRYAIHAYRTMFKVIHKNGVNIDIFIHFRDGDILWHGSVIHRWDNKAYGLTEYELEGISVLGPDNPEEYLTENYGDWRTPVTDFDCTTGTPNLVISKNFLSIALFLKRLGHFAHHDAHQYDKLRATLLRSGVCVEKDGSMRLGDFLQ